MNRMSLSSEILGIVPVERARPRGASAAAYSAKTARGGLAHAPGSTSRMAQRSTRASTNLTPEAANLRKRGVPSVPPQHGIVGECVHVGFARIRPRRRAGLRGGGRVSLQRRTIGTP